MVNMQWKLASPAPEEFLRIHGDYPPQLLHLIWNRGLRDARAIAEFFADPDFTRLPDPFLFTDMDTAVARLSRARERGEHVVVFGDYDADGACGATILTELLEAIGVDVSSYLPDRFTEGYGLTAISVKEILRRKTALVITVDCGVSDGEEIAALTARGVDTIVLDHHIVPEQLPKAVAVVDAHRNDDRYPFDWLCGAGVAFVFADAVRRRPLGQGLSEHILFRFADLAAVATIADLVPLEGPNRILVALGLRVLRDAPRLGLRKLMKIARVDAGRADTDTVAFELAPRINAASRMDHANTAFALLAANDEEEAETLAKTLDRHNRARQKKMQEMLVQAEQEVADLERVPEVILVAQEGWSRALVFGVAARLTDRYHRPVFAFALQDGVARGSARSVPGFDLVAAMRAAGGNELFQEFGGHAMAAGATLRAPWLPLLRERLQAYGRTHVTETMMQPVLEIDLELQPHEVSSELLVWFERLAPFGKGNPRPRLFIRDLTTLEARRFGRGEGRYALRFSPLHGGRVISATATKRVVGDGAGVRAGDRIDIVGELRPDWKHRGVELSLLGMRAAT